MQFQMHMAVQMGITVLDASTATRGLGWDDFHDWVGHLACTPKCVQLIQGLINIAELKVACTMPPPVLQSVSYLKPLPKLEGNT